MKCTVFVLLSALTILAAVISLACAGGGQDSSENMIPNATINTTLNQTTPGREEIFIGGARESIKENISLNAAEIATSNETLISPRVVKVLRVGGRSAKDSKALGGNSSSQRSGTEIGLEPKSGFNLSQRQGSVSKFKFNSDIYTPFFTQEQYTKTKPSYQAPENLSNRDVIDVSGYPVIMLPNSIPQGGHKNEI